MSETRLTKEDRNALKALINALNGAKNALESLMTSEPNIKTLVEAIENAEPVLQKAVDLVGNKVAKVVDDYLRALIASCAGFVATAVAVAGSVVIATVEKDAGARQLLYSGELLEGVSWVIIVSGIVIFTLQIARAFLSYFKIRPELYALGFSVVMLVPILTFVDAARTGACGGHMLTLPATLPQTKDGKPDLATLDLSANFLIFPNDCEDEIRRWVKVP